MHINSQRLGQRFFLVPKNTTNHHATPKINTAKESNIPSQLHRTGHRDRIHYHPKSQARLPQYTACSNYPGLHRTRPVNTPSRYRGRALTRTARPLARVLDVHLARGVHVPKEHAGQDGNRVLFVVDMIERRDVRVHVVRERLVADLQNNTPSAACCGATSRATGRTRGRP